jgi:hypothetical protein
LGCSWEALSRHREPNLGHWRGRCSPKEAGDGKEHGGGEGVNDRAGKSFSAVTWGSERIRVSHRVLRYCWCIRRMAVLLGWQQEGMTVVVDGG